MEVSGDVLVVIVEERPTVADVDFAATRSSTRTRCSRRPARHRPDRRPALRPGLLDRAEQELKRQYINRSLYAPRW
jgi:outer membrane protein insertion porin family